MGIGAKLLGLFTGGLGEKIGGVVDQLVKDKDLAERLKHELRMQQLVGEQGFRHLEVEAERDIELAIQQTHQAEANQSDIYTKRTRPRIARQSWYLTCAYGIYSMVAPLFPELPDIAFHWEMFVAMASPALTYMGVRSFDKWRLNG